MIITTKDNLIKILEDNNFEKETYKNGIPAVTYKKDGISITYIHNRFHLNEKAIDFIKEQNINYEEVEVKGI